MTARKRLNAMLDELFRNYQGDVADRLVLVQDGIQPVSGAVYRDLGGWNRIAVAAVLLKHFPELTEEP